MPETVKEALSLTTGALQENTLATVKATDTFGSMGLKGMVATISNLSAVTLICIMFYAQNRDNAEQAKQDRIQNREDTIENRKVIEKLADGFSGLTAEIRAWKNK